MNNENPIKNVSELIFPENVGREGASLGMRVSTMAASHIVIETGVKMENMFAGFSQLPVLVYR